MKKIIAVLLLTCTLVCFFGSCYPNEPSRDQPPSNNFFNFDSYGELLDWLKSEKNAERDDNENGETFLKFVSEAKEKTDKVLVPCFEGSALDLFREKGSIFLPTCELYGLPWIWYHGDINNNEITVKIAGLTENDKIKLSGDSMTEVIKNFSPKAVNTDNYQNFNGYSLVEEKEITVAGETIFGILYQPKDDTRVTYAFTFKDELIMITAHKDVLTEDLLSKLGFEELGNLDIK